MRQSSSAGGYETHAIIFKMEQINIQKIQNKNHLETEKLDILKVLSLLIDNVSFSDYEIEATGRPKFPIRDIIKSLLIMNYHSFSYRRSLSDIQILKELNFMSQVPKRATMNKYMQDPLFKNIIERLIEVSAISFSGIEDCLMIDSSQFFNKVLVTAEQRKKHQHRSSMFRTPPLTNTKKLHVCIARKSKIITCARTSKGTAHDHNFFDELISPTIKNGFRIKTVLADAAYNSKEHYIYCEENGIVGYLDFKKNSKLGRSQSALRRKQLIMYQDNKELWHEAYRFRVLVEGCFSSIKKRGRDYLRSLNDNAKDCEMLLKALWYNLGIISKEYHQLY